MFTGIQRSYKNQTII